MMSRTLFLACLFFYSIRSYGEASEAQLIPSLYDRPQSASAEKLRDLGLDLEAKLILQSEWLTTKARLYLGDFGECQGSKVLCEDVLAMDLGPSPKPGYDLFMALDTIKALVKVEFPKERMDILGPARIRIKALAIAPEQAVVQQAIENKIRETPSEFRLTLQQIRLPTSFRLRHQNYTIQFPNWQEDLAPMRQNPRRSLYQVHIRFQDTTEKELWETLVSLSLRIEVEAAVAKKSLARGLNLQKEDVDFRFVPYQENLVRSPESLQRQFVKIALRDGQAIRNFDIGRQPDVKRGEKIEAKVIAQGMVVHSPAQVLETAVEGQRVRLQLDSTKRQVMGTVMGPSQVEVRMP